MKAGDRRYTIEHLKGGQERPYADTVNRNRIHYEWIPYQREATDQFVPSDIDNYEWVQGDAQHFSGWVEEGKGDWASTRLVYLRKVEGMIGVWEWETKSAFTD